MNVSKVLKSRQVLKRSRIARKPSRFIKNGGDPTEDDLIAQIIYYQDVSWNHSDERGPPPERFMREDRHISDLVLQYKTLHYNEQKLRTKYEANEKRCRNPSTHTHRSYDGDNIYVIAHKVWLRQDIANKERNDIEYKSFKTRVESIAQNNDALTKELTDLEREYAEFKRTFPNPYTWLPGPPKPSSYHLPKLLYVNKIRLVNKLLSEIPYVSGKRTPHQQIAHDKQVSEMQDKIKVLEREMSYHKRNILRLEGEVETAQNELADRLSGQSSRLVSSNDCEGTDV